VSVCEIKHKGGTGIFNMIKGAFYGICRFAPREFLKNSEKAFRSAWKKMTPRKLLMKFSENSEKNILLRKKSEKNIFRRFQVGSAEAVRLEDVGYNPRGGDVDFPFPIQKYLQPKKPERSFYMNRELTQSLRGLGDALIKSYFNDWLPEKRRIDRYLEDIVLNSPILKSDRVQGGDHIPPQERLLQLKEENQGYQSLVRNIERMEAFLDGLNDDERALVDLYYRQGKDFWEISFKLKKERGDVLKNLFSIQMRLGCFWMGESEVRNARA
jgi:hypothetical protein